MFNHRLKSQKVGFRVLYSFISVLLREMYFWKKIDMFSTLITNTENNICTITINRPDKLNALNKMVIEELGIAIEKVYQDSEIKAAIITGAGPKAFVAGADITEFLALDARGGEELARKGQ